MISEQELIDRIKEVFEGNESCEKVFATSDGNIFLETSENSARLHSKNSGLELKIYIRNGEELTPLENNLNNGETSPNDLDNDDDPDKLSKSSVEPNSNSSTPKE